MTQRADLRLQLTPAMAAGDEQAIEDFYRALLRLALSEGPPRHGARRGLLSRRGPESVLRIVRCVQPVESEGRFRAWLRLVVQSTAYDLMKSDARRARREAVAGAAVSPVRRTALRMRGQRSLGSADRSRPSPPKSPA